MKKTILSASELLKLISEKQWANSTDLMKISGKCRNYADKDKREIIEQLEKQGYRLPRGLVPMDVVVDYYKINITYLKKVANINKK